MDMAWLTTLQNSQWQGRGELWLDPEGNEAQHYDCSLVIEKDNIQYSWQWEGKTQQGRYLFDNTLNKKSASWSDSWHQPEPVDCKSVVDTGCLFSLFNAYKVPSNPDWGWRSQLSQRPSQELILQMTNITPWGEEGRAVRMVFNRI